MEVIYELMNANMKFLQGGVGTVLFWIGELTLLGCLIYGWKMYNALEKADEIE